MKQPTQCTMNCEAIKWTGNNAEAVLKFLLHSTESCRVHPADKTRIAYFDFGDDYPSFIDVGYWAVRSEHFASFSVMSQDEYDGDMQEVTT